MTSQISFRKLARIATIGGFVVVGFGYHMRNMFQRRLRQTKIYKEALEILRNHEKTVLHLGEPIKEGRILCSDKVDDIRKFSVNLKGSKTKGVLDCEVLLAVPENPEIGRLGITFADIPDKVFEIKEIQKIAS